MTRKEFSDKLAQLRVERGVSKYAVCKFMNRTNSQLVRIEKAEHSYSFDIALNFLESIKCRIKLLKDKNVFNVTTSENLVDFLRGERESFSSRIQFANHIGKSVNSILKIETHQIKLTIDMFLVISEALGFTIEFEPYD